MRSIPSRDFSTDFAPPTYIIIDRYKAILFCGLLELSKGKALFILHVMIGMLSLHLMQSEIIIYGLVRKCVKLSPFSYTIFILDLALNYIANCRYTYGY